MSVSLIPRVIDDLVSGLRIEIIEGENLNRISITHGKAPARRQRDFFFAKDGSFDGTGSSCVDPVTEDETRTKGSASTV